MTLEAHRLEQKRALRWHQRRDKDYFDHWRRGYRHDERARAMFIANLRFPNAGQWPGFGKGRTLQLPHHLGQRIRAPWNEAGPSSTKMSAKAAAAALAKQMQPAGFKFIKVLGWGGLGVCSLYEVDDGVGNRIKVVCKMDLETRYNYINAEIKSHVATAGAKHVVQRVVLKHHHTKIEQVNKQLSAFDPPDKGKGKGKGKADDDSGYLTGPDRGRADDDFEMIEAPEPEPFEAVEKKFVELDIKKDFKAAMDAHERVLFIEFMSRGRFDDHIGRVAKENGEFPNHVLWQVFDCLFRAVIGMAYPKAFQPVGSDPRAEHIQPVTETSRGLPLLDSNSKSNRLIHFDLESLNVLVGDFDPDEHNIVPLIKVSDLGLAKMFNGQERDPWTLWLTRRTGKTDIYTPEQHTQEWDWVDEIPDRRITPTAGNYNWWTNLYQVALIMWKLVTLCEYECPPVIEEVELSRPDSTTTKEWTYGAYVLDPQFDHIDVDLRNIVALCMIHDPTRRPTMEYLEQTIKKRLDNAAAANNVPLRQWVQEVFSSPPPPQQVIDHLDPKAYENLRGWKEEPKKDMQVDVQRQAEHMQYLNNIARRRRMGPVRMLANKFGSAFLRDMLG